MAITDRAAAVKRREECGSAVGCARPHSDGIFSATAPEHTSGLCEGILGRDWKSSDEDRNHRLYSGRVVLMAQVIRGEA